MIADNIVNFASNVPPKAGLCRNTRQTPSDLFQIKVTTELKNDITKLGEWEAISSNSEKRIF